MARSKSVPCATPRRSLIVKLRIPSLDSIHFDQTPTTATTGTSSSLAQPENHMSAAGGPNSRDPILNIDDMIEAGPITQSSSTDEWSPEYTQQLTSLCDSGTHDDDLIMIPQKQLKDVNLLQLRLSYGLQDLVDVYNIIHEGDLLHEWAVRKRFTNAFSVVAKRAGVPVEDLKKSYNSITKATKTRQYKSKLEVASKPAGVVKEKGSKRSKSKSVSFVPEVTADKEIKKAQPRRKRTIKDEIVGAPEVHEYAANAKSEGELQADKRFAQLRAESSGGEKIPWLPFYHPIIRMIIDKKNMANLHIESLQEINRIGTLYSVKNITVSINSWVPDCTDTEQVGQIIYKALTEIEKRDEDAARKEEFDRSHVTQKGSLWPRYVKGWCAEKPLPVPGSMGLEVGEDIVMP